jgi:hypothetical protein
LCYWYDNIDGWLLFGHKNSHHYGHDTVAMLLFSVSCWHQCLVLYGLGVVVLVVEESTQIEQVMSVELLVRLSVWLRVPVPHLMLPGRFSEGQKL